MTFIKIITLIKIYLKLNLSTKLDINKDYKI